MNNFFQKKMNCPACRQKFRVLSVSDHYGRHYEIDICLTCRLIWFDELEEVKLNKKWVIKLLEIIRDTPENNFFAGHFSGKNANFLCPRCENPLKKQQDKSFSGDEIETHICPDHGTLYRFDDFFRLKGLYKAFNVDKKLKPLFVRCKNCGNNIDPTSREDCEYCSTPFSFFDKDILLQVLEETNQSARSF
jgi:Zn-finger nucleic acid-binding protein